MKVTKKMIGTILKYHYEHRLIGIMQRFQYNTGWRFEFKFNVDLKTLNNNNNNNNKVYEIHDFCTGCTLKKLHDEGQKCNK